VPGVGKAPRIFIFPSRMRAWCAPLSMPRRTVSSQRRRRKRPTSNVQRAMIRANLPRVLEKHVLESRLKRAGIAFADSKLRSDFELRGTMDLHVDPAALCQGCADCFQGQRGRVAIAAEMSQHNALDLAGQQFLDYACRSAVRQMTVTGLDPLFHRPRPMHVVLQ